MYKETVQKYYDYTLPFYRLFWHGYTRAVHYGIWDKETKNLKESLLNTNQVMADTANIKLGEKVLDAGCGVGGSAFWLAKNRGANVRGITISQSQINKAIQLSKRLGLENQTQFSLQDYEKTNFENSSFDVVWGLESVCHAQDKLDFIKEAYRILNPGGRIVVADGFLEHDQLNPAEAQQYKNFLKGLALDNLAQPETFENQLNSAGFKNVKNIDKTNDILPTSVLMAKMSSWSYPLTKVTSWLKITPELLADNNRAGIDQLFLFKNRILTYRVFVAEK